MRTSNEEYLRRLKIVSNNIKFFDIIRDEVDKVSHIIEKLDVLERRVIYKVAESIERGFAKEYMIRSSIKRAIGAEINRATKDNSKRPVLTFTSLEKKSNEGDSVIYDVKSNVDIEEEFLQNETIALIYNFAKNNLERTMINGMLDGLSDMEIGRKLSEMDNNKYTLQAYRKSVRKFKLRCADALRTEVFG